MHYMYVNWCSDALWYFWNNILVSWSCVLLLCWFNGSDVQVCWMSGLLVNWGTDSWCTSVHIVCTGVQAYNCNVGTT